MIAPANIETLADLIAFRAADSRDALAFRMLDGAGHVSASATYAEIAARAAHGAHVLAERVIPGSRVLLVGQTSIDWVGWFLACALANVVAVPVSHGNARRTRESVARIAADCRGSLIVASETIRQSGAVSDLGIDVIAMDAPWVATDPAALDCGVVPDSVALLQYTSGTTGRSRGAVITQGAILANERAIAAAFGHGPQSHFVSWLPLFHDMGLIGGVLQPFFLGSEATLIAPAAFLNHPVIWLRAIDRFGAATSGGPDFAYRLCVDRIPAASAAALDLSRWRVAFNGAEPVRARTIERFIRAFAPSGFDPGAMYPCYGLAEATLFVAGSRAGQGADIRRIGDLGAVQPDAGLHDTGGDVIAYPVRAAATTVRILDPETGAELPEGTTGEIAISGASVFRGYWPEGAAAPVRGAPEAVHTGDLGTLLNGALIVTGRQKDLVILRGTNFHAEEIEGVAMEASPQVRLCAAFSLHRGDGEDAVALVLEAETRDPRERHALVDRVRADVTNRLGLVLDDLAFARRRQLPRTSSGKPRRAACKEAFLAGRYASVDQAAAPETRARQTRDVPGWLLTSAAALTGQAETELDSNRSLVEQGLDSVAATRLVVEVERLSGCKIALEQVLDGMRLSDIADALALAGISARATTAPSATVAEKELSPYEQMMLLFDRLSGDGAYLLCLQLDLDGVVDVAALQGAIDDLMRRHPALRRRLRRADGVTEWDTPPDPPCQVLRHVDLKDQSKQAFQERLTDLANGRLDPYADPLFQAVWVEQRADRSALILRLHHCLADQHSALVLLRDLFAAYAAGTCATGADVADAVPSEIRPSDAAGRDTRVLLFAIGTESWARVKTVARAVGATPFSVLLTCFGQALSTAAGQTQIEIVTPVSVRTDPTSFDAVGCFVNSKRIRMDGLTQVSDADAVRRVYGQVLGATRDRFAPYRTDGEGGGPSAIVTLHANRVPGVPPIWNALALPDVGISHGLAGGLTATAHRRLASSPQAPLALDIALTGARCLGCLEFDPADMPGETARQVLAAFRTRLESIGSGQDGAGPPPLSIRRAATTANAAIPPLLQGLHDWAERTPDAIALEPDASCDGVTYARLRDDVLGVAAAIAQRLSGDVRGHRVALLGGGTRDMVTGVLGVLQAGAVAVPIDQTLPNQRRNAMQNGCALVLAEADVAALMSGAASLSAARAGSTACPDDVAYEVYTSGSTGTPKRVAVQRSALANHARTVADRLALAPSDRVLQFHSPSFDMFFEDVLPALDAGSAIVLRDPSGRSGQGFDPDALLRLIEATGATVLNVPPSAWAEMSHRIKRGSGKLPKTLRLVVLGSEPVLRCHVDDVVAAGAFWVNAYGLSEAAVTSLTTAMSHAACTSATPDVGHPLANTSVYVLDTDGHPVPPGVEGTIWLGGVGLSLGYPDDPRQTAESFRPDPFAVEPGARMLATGDRGIMSERGAVRVLGRKDRQLQIRGYRVEPGEIEAVLKAVPGVTDASVLAQVQPDGATRLVAVYVAETGQGSEIDEPVLRTALRSALPASHLPSRIIAVARLPRGGDGDVDRDTISEHFADLGAAADRGVPELPDTPQDAVAALWERVLGRAQPDRERGFFDSGGDSLTLLRLHRQLEDAFGVRIQIADLFDAATVQTQAHLIERLLGSRDQQGPSAAVPDETGARTRRMGARLKRAGRPTHGSKP